MDVEVSTVVLASSMHNSVYLDFVAFFKILTGKTDIRNKILGQPDSDRRGTIEYVDPDVIASGHDIADDFAFEFDSFPIPLCSIIDELVGADQGQIDILSEHREQEAQDEKLNHKKNRGKHLLVWSHATAHAIIHDNTPLARLRVKNEPKKPIDAKIAMNSNRPAHMLKM